MRDGWGYTASGAQVHHTAVIAPWAVLGEGCVVHPFAVVGRLPDPSRALARQPEQEAVLSIGRNTVIGCHAVVYGGVEIGEDSFLGDYASVREGTRIGARCVIGRQVTINYNVRIAGDCRFQDGTHITGDCEIGEGCFFGVGVVTSNDRNVDLEDYHFPMPPQPCLFGERVLVGSGANVLAGVRVGDRATIGAGALVTRHVPPGAIMLGPRAEQRRHYAPGEAQAEAISDAQLLWDTTR